MLFLFFIWKNGLSFGRDINGICRCVEFVGVIIISPVWYMCLKTENCCLKIFVEIRVGEKTCKNT